MLTGKSLQKRFKGPLRVGKRSCLSLQNGEGRSRRMDVLSQPQCQQPPSLSPTENSSSCSEKKILEAGQVPNDPCPMHPLQSEHFELEVT